MRRASGLIHTSEMKILLSLPSNILVLIFVNVKTLIMLMLVFEKAHGRPRGGVEPMERIFSNGRIT